MAKTKTKPEKNGVTTGPMLEIACSYANVNIGDKTARLGISTSRGNLTVSQADKQLCGKRLTGKLLARRGGGGSDQQSLPGAEDDIEIQAVFDVKGFGVTGKNISFGATFALASIDVETLAHFAKTSGIVYILEAADIPEGEEEDDA